MMALFELAGDSRLEIKIPARRSSASRGTWLMADEQGKPNFWTTLPGILTGIAAVVTAAGGIILGLHQMSAPSAGQGRADNPAASGVMTPASKQETLPSQSQSASSSPSVSPASTTSPQAPLAGDGIPAKAVRITKTDGTVIWSFEDKFFLGGCGQCSFAFATGQSIPFEKIRTLDVLGVDAEGKRSVRVVLANGKVIEGVSDNSVGVGGTNDVGEIRVDDNQVKRVTFPH